MGGCPVADSQPAARAVGRQECRGDVMEFESRGCLPGCGSCGGEKSTLRGLESGANKTRSPSPGPSCRLLIKILQEFGEKEENRVRAEQEQGIVGDI